MNKLTQILMIFLTLTLVAGIGIADFAGGEGTKENPYQIENFSQLELIPKEEVDEDPYYLDDHYALIDDINATETSNSGYNDGDGWEPIGNVTDPFNSSFDGQGYEISDLYINRPDKFEIGLFEAIDSDAVIENVSLVDVNITGHMDVGGLIGYNNGSVSGSYVTGSVNGDGIVGGLIGGNDGSVTGSYSTSNVTGSGNEIGGLIGTNDEGSVSDSYATGSVDGDNDVGGLIGLNSDGSVSDSYSNGDVTGSDDDDVGGLIGDQNNDSFVSNSYWNTETSGQDDSDRGTGLTTSEMTGKSAEGNMTGFDFDEIWHLVIENKKINPIPTENGYPILQALDTETQLEQQDIETYSEYNLTISSTEGGNVTTPEEGTFTYNESEVIDLIVEADENYTFTGWTGDNGTIDNASSNETTITMEGNYTITANFEEETEDEETEPTPVTPTAAPGQNTTTILILFLAAITIYTINKKG